jgi:hypothetical protein
MPTIEISFDTYKQLTMRREHERVSYDDVIRGLMKLPPVGDAKGKPSDKKSWQYKGATLPHGTDIRCSYKGAEYAAKIDDGKWVQDGKVRTSPSEAAHAVTGNSVNGWTFWEARLPGEDRWRILKSMH